MRKTRLIRLGMAMAAVAASSTAAAEDPIECFDALVSAKILRQTPSAFPNCGDDCIIISWPWFMEIDVKRVIEGRAPKGRQLILTVQHTSFRKDPGTRRWWLRRNSLGGFNLLRTSDEKLPRCTEDSMPTDPYIRPAPGQTLDDLVREGEEAYPHGS